MARVLIVGCGCRGRALGRGLRAEGHAVRGTTRDPAKRGALQEDGIEAWVGDPDRLGTLTPALDGVTVACWLFGTAAGATADLAALHGPRLRAFCERVVDTTVRGLVYEAAGTVPPELLTHGAGIVREASRTWNVPVRILDVDPSDRGEWLRAAHTEIEELLDDRRPARLR